MRAAFGHVRPLYIPVHLDGLVLDSVVDFHLHLQTSPGHFVLFRGPDLEFTTAHHARLLANNVQTLWLKGDERRRYEQYVERHLETLLSNPQIATPRKVELLQSAAQTTLESVMIDPRHSEAVPRTRRVAQQTVQLDRQGEGGARTHGGADGSRLRHRAPLDERQRVRHRPRVRRRRAQSPPTCATSRSAACCTTSGRANCPVS